jgi:transcriptional regulator with XRE-family HTH domain
MPPRQPRDAQAERRLRAFGARVRQARHDLGRSQEDFAHDCGVHRTYIGAVERGEVNMSLLNAYRIADGLGVPLGTLVP